MTQQPIGKFYDSLDISFLVGSVRCRALKLSFEQCHPRDPRVGQDCVCR